MIKNINADELKKLLDKGDIILVDVRESAEHNAESINGARLIPLSEISHEKLPSKAHPVVVHCASGRRSEAACKRLIEQDPDLQIYNLEGGINAWKQAGHAVKTSGKKIFPLDRQMQITAGTLVLSGVILGFLLNPWFFALSGFVGAGLMFAGISGWCGMMKLLAIMPWNK